LTAIQTRAEQGRSEKLECDIVLRFRNGNWHAWCGAYGLHASAASADDAIATLERAHADLRRFSESSGLGHLAGLANRRPRMPSGLKRGLVILIMTGLIAIQFGYAITLGGRGALRAAFTREWRDTLYDDLERQLAQMADPKHRIDPERQKKIIEALRIVKGRYKPIIDEVFGPSPEAASASDPARSGID